MEILFVGDSHGNLRFFRQVADLAAELNVGAVVSVGDFGFWPGGQFTDPVNRLFVELGIPLNVVRGNHDSPLEAARYRRGGQDFLNPGLGWLPDGEVATIDGKRFCFTGGAISVDKDARIPDVSWWEGEVTSDEDVQRTLDVGRVDIWVTHDSAFPPPGFQGGMFGPSLTAELKIQSQKMEKMFHSLKPRLHIHGHWHHRYSAPTPYGQVVGLGFESSDALMLVDCER